MGIVHTNDYMQRIRQIVQEVLNKVAANQPQYDSKDLQQMKITIDSPQLLNYHRASMGDLGPIAYGMVLQARSIYPELSKLGVKIDSVPENLNLAERARLGHEYRLPQSTSNFPVQSPTQKPKNPSEERYAPRYRRYTGLLYSAGGKASKVYNSVAEVVAKLFGRLRQRKVYAPELQRSANKGYDTNKAVILAFKTRNARQSTENPNNSVPQQTLDDRVRKYKLRDTA